MTGDLSWTSTSSTGGTNLSLWTTHVRSAPVAQRSTDDEGVDRSLLSVSPSLITTSGVPTEEQFEDIRSRFGDPRANAKPDDYYVFRLIASGDGLDSYFTKQDLLTSFPNFVKDLHKGQSVLGSHLMATFSYGSSFAGEITPADEDRSEYEPTFYPQWDSPELRTRNWLVGDYFITRGVTLNNQPSDDLIRAIELGAVRKTSISFMVGSYVCGIDNRDLIPTMFGPMPDEECNHFPGIAYDDGKGGKQIAWALMKNNTLVETSLVYKNASPSSMLLRKAETLASRGQLNARDIEKLESRFQIRLPRFQPTIFPTTSTASSASTAETLRFDAQVQEDNDMANRRRGGNDAAREMVREALTAAPEPEDETTVEVSEAPESADLTSEAALDPESEPETSRDADTPEAEAREAEAEAVAEDDGDSAESSTTEPDEAAAAEPETIEAEAEAEEGEAVAEPVEAAAEGEEASEEDEADTTETTSESSREEDAVAAFVTAADRLASVIARNPDAFDSGLLAMAARAEKAIDLALIDAGCDATVGSQVYRSFEVRSKKLTEALGEPLTVEAIRSLQTKAQLGDELFRELVKDAVAARVGAQGESFSADRYKEVLLGTRDVQYVKDEIASWKSAKKETFAPGRQVVPRQPVDTKSTKDERKTLPEAPVAIAAKPKSEAPSMSLIQPRKK